jgi:HK97 family phage major capsid protein
MISPNKTNGISLHFGPETALVDSEMHRMAAAGELDEVRGLNTDGWEGRANEIIKYTTLGGDTPKVGYTVPVTTLSRIVDHINAASGVLECNVTKLNTASGETMNMAALATDATAAIGAEATAATQGYPVMAQRVLDAYDMNVYFPVSVQLLQDSAADIESFIYDIAGRSMGTLLASYYAIGTGTSQPQGINHTTPVTTLGVTTASPTSITYAEYIKLFLSVLPGYRKTGDWLLGDLAYSDLVLATNENGDFYYRPGDPLIQRPVHIEANYPANTAGLIPVTFGDMSRFYIRTVGGITIMRDDSFLFTSRLATFLCFTRTDSELVDRTGAVKHLIMHA